MATNNGKRFKFSPQAAWRKIDEEVIILNVDNSVYYSLNETGAAVWEKLGAGTAPDEIAAEISREYGAALPSVEKDVAEIISNLRKEKLLIDA
ncbi:MAG: PqqD family protein [Elusimicrobiota bacterium]